MPHQIFLLFSLIFKCAKIMLHVHFPSPENCGSVSTGRLFLGLFGCRIFLLWFEIIFWRFGMVLYEIFTLFLLTTFARGWFSGKHFLKRCRNFWKVHMELCFPEKLTANKQHIIVNIHHHKRIVCLLHSK